MRLEITHRQEWRRLDHHSSSRCKKVMINKAEEQQEEP